ncbi:hypothetical protein HK096_005575 [Nowakowskiella sp. JEL0078]|nr:hypothetical protein HK096_005575 [Nowakowskiella sp. JEL0078]
MGEGGNYGREPLQPGNPYLRENLLHNNHLNSLEAADAPFPPSAFDSPPQVSLPAAPLPFNRQMNSSLTLPQSDVHELSSLDDKKVVQELSSDDSDSRPAPLKNQAPTAVKITVMRGLDIDTLGQKLNTLIDTRNIPDRRHTFAQPPPDFSRKGKMSENTPSNHSGADAASAISSISELHAPSSTGEVIVFEDASDNFSMLESEKQRKNLSFF